MSGEIITIGNELTQGRTLDLNSWYAAGKLAASGLDVMRITTVGDDYKTLSDALKRAMDVSRFIILTGGLGPTDDDITCEIAAGALNRPLCPNQQMLDKIKNLIKSMGKKMSPLIEKMALLPEGSEILDPEGKTCGFFLIEKGVHLFFLPGVPDQMRFLLDNFVLPELRSLYRNPPGLHQRILKIYGLDEPSITEIFRKIKGVPINAVFGFYPSFPENHITISLKGEDEHQAAKELDEIVNKFADLLGPYMFSAHNQTMEEVAGAMLSDRNLSLSVAESCTGGMISHRLTNVPGSSKYFLGGLITYSNQSKSDLLRVRAETLDKYGAVSDNIVREMARGVRESLKSDLGLAVTGIAGPDGGSPEKPVGTVYIGLSAESKVFSHKYLFRGNRDKVKLNTSTMALDWIRKYLNGDTFISGL